MNFNISGAAVYFRIPTGIPILGDFLISETLVVSWIVMILITGLCIWFTRDLKVENISKRQAVAEMLVEQAQTDFTGTDDGHQLLQPRHLSRVRRLVP